MIVLKPYKRPEYPHLGFAGSDAIYPVGCRACGWYGTDPKHHVASGPECPGCGSRALRYFPRIEPDMLQ